MDVFICGVCREEFHDIVKFMQHKKSLSDSFACDICNIFFHYESELKVHNKMHVMSTSNEETNNETVTHITVADDANLAIIPSVDGGNESTVLGSIHIVYADASGTQNITELENNQSQTEVGETETPVVVSVGEVSPFQQNLQLGEPESIQIPAEGIFVCKLCSSFTFSQVELCKHLLVAHNKEVTPESLEASEYINKLMPIPNEEEPIGADSLSDLNKNWNTMHLEVTQDNKKPGTLQLLVKSNSGTNSTDGIPKRKRGRPKKSELLKRQEEKKKTDNDEIEDEVIKNDNVPILGTDGRYHCSKCKKSFRKERHFHGHRCWGSNAEHGDYIDLSKKEIKEDGEETDLSINNTEEEDAEIDTDITEDFKAYIPNRICGRNQRRGFAHHLGRNSNKKVENIAEIPENKENEEKNSESCSESQNNINPIIVENVNGDESVETEDKRPLGYTTYVPVFTSDDQKKLFEEKVNSIDLSCVDHLFMKHIVEQNVNEYAPKNAFREKEELEVFSCNVCKKVFKTLSHMRLHCLTHTDLKPFKCPECTYASNAKGNLYTHMRKHTGNFFTCSVCEFKSCNRSHMIEHEATHTSVRHKCQICSNDYNTLKSLMNHVRKYHRATREGRDYLMTFMLKANKSAAILHQCHVCNRKFKKKLDRDRHLFIHNIQNNPYLLNCELCDYSASRRSYLENHFRKHRVIYVCCVCNSRFLSSIRLSEHLPSHSSAENENNFDENSTKLSNAKEHLFEQCINMSWYLPEPDGALGVYQYANIPKELVRKNEEFIEDEQDVTGDKVSIDSSSLSTNEMKGNESLDEQMQTDVSSSDASRQTLDILITLNYKPMTMSIFQKIRETFGNEECEFCGRLFHSKCDYEPHFRTHTEDKPEKCPRCDYSAVTKDNLKRHIETVHEKKRFVCSQCGYIALSRTSMWHHQQKHRDVNTECPECKKSFGNLKKLRAHIICAHPGMNRSEATKLTGYNHRIQGRLGRRSYKCPYCDRVFHRSNTDLQKHIWIHEGIKPYKCPICPHSCRSRNNLNVHMLRHSSEKPHLCDECGKAYKSKTALRWHVRSHSEGQLYACDRCEYTGSQKSHLKRHMETHDVIKRYVCQHCKYSSNTLGYMKVHYARKHKGETFNENDSAPPVTGEGKVYKCISCEYLFGNLSDMKRHLRVRHHVNILNLKEIDWTDGVAATETAVAAVTMEEEQTDDSYQMIQVETEEGTRIARISNTALQELQLASSTDGEMEVNTASAVNIIQQIIAQSAFTQTVESIEDHGLITINPDSIIVQEEAQEVIVGGNGGEGQFVIQYLTPSSTEEETQVYESIDQPLEES